MFRRIWTALCAALLLVSCFPAVAEAVEVSATACVLMDADTGAVLYQKNEGQRMLIASTTKLMTALVALEQGHLSETVTVTAAHMAEGSSMYLRAGECLTVEELGMADTHFANPNGLDDEGHYSTAYDMALLACAAVNEPTLRRIAATRTAVIGGRTLTNHNKLLGRVDGCIGLKTGYTKAAGRTLVSCAQREGCRLVAVTLRDGDDWNDHETLYRYGFALAAVRRELYARLLRALDNTGGATP